MLTVHKMAASGDAIAASALASSGATIALLVRQVREGSVEEQTAAARSLRFLCAHEASRATIVGVEGVSALVSVAHSGQAGARRDAALVLACLSLLPHTSAVASSSGAVEVMVAAAAQLC